MTKWSLGEVYEMPRGVEDGIIKVMPEKFPEQIQSEKIEKEQKVEVKLPEDVRDAIYNKGKFGYDTKDHNERRLVRIEKWLRASNTREELGKMLELLQLHCYEFIGDEGGGQEAAEILGKVLENVLFEKREKTKE